MNEEFHAVEDNHIWKSVHCPFNVKAIGYKWANSLNIFFDGSLDCYTRLVFLD